jgi:hypothetical protein
VVGAFHKTLTDAFPLRPLLNDARKTGSQRIKRKLNRTGSRYDIR